VLQRAYLPDGVTNFVTPAGMNQLLAEKQMLENERNNLNNASEKVSFLSPVSRVLINKKTGDKVTLKQTGKDHVFEVISISY
jgi:hypothetical protein